MDEVLAVGDAEFQKKAIGKMQDVSANDGRTVLFVSHNMASIDVITSYSIHYTKLYELSSLATQQLINMTNPKEIRWKQRYNEFVKVLSYNFV